MGVDRQVTIAWGCRVELPPPMIKRWQNGEFDEGTLPGRVVLLEWGGRNYGSPWGLVLALAETITTINPKEECDLIKSLPDDRSWDRVHATGRLLEALEHLKPFSSRGEPGWQFFGHTY
jgi:hypothetical protein